MTALIDVVNFNGDSSCMDSARWLEVLSGGERSQLFRWLRLYIDLGKPIVLGFTGSTLADIGAFNPEALPLLRCYPDVFQIIIRPFAHDLPFFRTEEGFRLNLTLGRRVAEHLIGRVAPIYLPPEFMQTNQQTALLADLGVQSTFIMASRFRERHVKHIPDNSFIVKGIPTGELICVPALGALTQAYLATIQVLDSSMWSGTLSSCEMAVVWRDGESSFLLPDGLEREEIWLKCSDESRWHLNGSIAVHQTQAVSYPIHPFSAWMNEMSMLWFILRVRDLEKRALDSMSPLDIARWLHCINSDILSAIEKDTPVVQLRALETGVLHSHAIFRSDRGYEGEALLEMAEKGGVMPRDQAWQLKALAREKLIHELL